MTEQKYIERGELLRKMSLEANRSALGEFSPPHLSYGEMLTLVKEAPTADVVKVVRCKNCKHLKMAGTTPRCNFYKGLATTVNPPTDYCSFGEPKECES